MTKQRSFHNKALRHCHLLNPMPVPLCPMEVIMAVSQWIYLICTPIQTAQQVVRLFHLIAAVDKMEMVENSMTVALMPFSAANACIGVMLPATPAAGLLMCGTDQLPNFYAISVSSSPQMVFERDIYSKISIISGWYCLPIIHRPPTCRSAWTHTRAPLNERIQ